MPRKEKKKIHLKFIERKINHFLAPCNPFSSSTSFQRFSCKRKCETDPFSYRALALLLILRPALPPFVSQNDALFISISSRVRFSTPVGKFQWRHFNEVFYTPSSPRRWVESALNLDRFFGTFKDSPPGWKGFPPPFFVLSLACWPALEVYFPSLIIISIIIMLTTRCFSPLRWQSGLEKLENVASHNPRELLILSILHQLWFGFSGRSPSRTSSDSNLILVRGEESLEKFPSPGGSVGSPCRGLVDVVVGRN